jgi:hypothetical protein
MKSVIVHGALALIGLWLSYQTWTRTEEPEQVPGTATILECEPSQVTALEIESPSHTVSIVPKHAAGKTEYWITSQHKKTEPSPESKAGEGAQVEAKPAAGEATSKDKDAAGKDAAAKSAPGKEASGSATAPAKDAKADAAAAKPEAAKPPAVQQPRPYDPDAPVTFLASPKFDEFLKLFAPLKAQRDLGVLPKDKLAQFGFDKDKPGTTLRVACGDRKVALDVGGRTFGTNDSYVRDAKTNQAYLVGGQMLMDLQSAQFKFMHAELRDFPLSEVDEAVVSARGRSRQLTQRNRNIKEQARWVDAAAPDKRNELFATWFQRVEKLKVKSFMDEGKQPGSDLKIEANAMEPVLTIEYKLEGKPKGKLELVRVDTKQGNFYYARSEITSRWMVMYDSSAKQVEEDVALVVGAEEAPAQTPAIDSPADAPDDALPPGHPGVAH